jgi:hypothetical protein
MEIKSKLYIADKIENTQRRFGENRDYVPAFIVFPDGTQKPALFTSAAIVLAVGRASDNPEDAGSFEDPGFLKRIFG